MKTRSIFLLALAAAFATCPALAQVSGLDSAPDGVVLKKYVEEGSIPNTYTINLETFVTGESITEEGILEPIDYSLILDTSGSMMEFVGYGYTALENKKYSYPELADGYTSLTKWRDETAPARYNVSYNGQSWTGYATKYAIKSGSTYKHVLLCTYSGDYVAVAGNIGENSVSDVTALSGSQYSSFSSGKTNKIQLYSAAQSGTKLQLLKDAVYSFIDIVSGHAKENKLDHTVSIVRYNADSKTNGTAITDYTGTNNEGAAVIRNFKLLNETGTTNADALKAGVSSLAATSQTYPYHGVDLVKAMYDGQTIGGKLIKNNGHKKIIILFSDGEPGSSGFNKTNANKTIAGLYTLKQSYGATVFTIGVFAKVDNKCHQYMNAASQNYPNATTYEHAVKDGSADVTAHDFYKLVGTDSLSDIFEQIATETTTGGASYKLDATSTTIIDVVADSFQLPEGADGSKIRLSVAPCTDVKTVGDKKEYIFGTAEDARTKFPGITAKVGTFKNLVFTEEAGGKAVQIANYDFSENWVGENIVGSTVTYHGYKLIISFDIEIDPNNPGGATENTNTAESGIYYDSDGDGIIDQIGAYEIPTVKIPNLVIIKRGLRKGDSAIFSVYQVEENGSMSKFPIELVATQGDGEYAIVRAKMQKPGRYMVEESEWSWAYGITECKAEYAKEDTNVTEQQWNDAGFGSGYQYSIPKDTGTAVSGRTITRNLNDFTEEEKAGEYKGTVFEFTNEPASGIPPHAESYKNNIFVSPGK